MLSRTGKSTAHNFSLPSLRHRSHATVRSNRLFTAEGGVVTNRSRHGGSGRGGRGIQGSQRPRSGPVCLSMLVGPGQVTYQDTVTCSRYPTDVETRSWQQLSVSA